MDSIHLIWMSVICFHFDLCQSFSYHFELYQLTGPFQIWLSLPSYHHMRTVQIIFRDHSKNCTAWWNSFKIMYMKNAHNFNLVQDETWIWTIPKSTHYCTAWWNSLRIMAISILTHNCTSLWNSLRILPKQITLTI